MSDSLTEQTLTTDKAAAIGAEHGRNAAAWVFDGNTTNETYRTVLRGIEDGDPTTLDSYRTPNLSGEFADDYSEVELMRDLGIDPVRMAGSWLVDDAANAYNDAASESFWTEVERMARDHVETDAISALKLAGLPVCWLDNDAVTEYGYAQPYTHYRHNSPTANARAYVDLSGIAKDEDTYGQSSTLERSNYRSLERDYPDAWLPTGYSNVNGLGAYIADLTPELTEVLTGLAADYPVYDEEDMSELESDEITEQWDDFGAYELASAFRLVNGGAASFT